MPRTKPDHEGEIQYLEREREGVVEPNNAGCTHILNTQIDMEEAEKYLIHLIYT